MTTANLDAGDLKAADFNGLIREDVMDQIWDISNIPLPLTNAVGRGTTGNDYAEWTMDKLNDPELGGFVVDGADSDQNDAKAGTRVGNHCGILTKEVRVSTRARESNTIGYSDALAYQVMERQKELRRDVEANALHIAGSQASDPDGGVEGVPAGLAAQFTQLDTGSGATGGGFSAGLFTAITPGAAPVPLTETMIRDAAQAAWEDGGDPSMIMSVPSVIRKLSEYMFTSSSRIATLTRESQGTEAATAVGSVNVFLTDFGVVLDMVPNRIQRTYTVGASPGAAVYVMDPAYVEMCYLHGYRVEPLAKTGLSDKRMMAVDWTVKVLEPNSGRVLLDIDPAAPVTQA